MDNKSYLTLFLGLLFVFVYFSPLGSRDQNVFGSVSNDDDGIDDGIAADESLQQSLPNNGTSGVATNIYDAHEFNVGDNALNLFILIPNEGHHGPGEEDEARYLNQPFVPESVTVSPGTNVVWFNGDVGHEHNIAISDSRNGGGGPTPLYQTGEFSEFDARNYTFNEIGDFSYADTVEYENGFIMRGNISVTDDNNYDTSSPQGTTEAATPSQTMGLLMVPTEDLAQYTLDLQSRGFVIDSTHNFPDLREGDEQTLVVWEASESSSSDTPTILADLAEVSQQLPYS
ncbi:MAG: cupredoxin domain-containing protein [Nitrososphaeraceae archaeon]